MRLDGDGGWALSPGGLVTAMTAVMEGRDAVWIGWDGGLGDAAESAPPARFGDMALRSVSLSETDYADYYEGFSNGTLWPLYHNGLLSTAFVDPGGLPIDGSTSSSPRSRSRPPNRTARSGSTTTTCS